MNEKRQYISKYIVRSALPVSVLTAVLSACVILMASSNGDAEFYAAVVACVVAIVLTLGYYVISTLRFSRMIESQMKKYGLDFSTSKIYAVVKSPKWVICSDKWLVCPGKLALCKSHISSASVVVNAERGGIRYTLKLKTQSGEKYTLKFKNEKSARKVQRWACGK